MRDKYLTCAREGYFEDLYRIRRGSRRDLKVKKSNPGTGYYTGALTKKDRDSPFLLMGFVC